MRRFVVALLLGLVVAAAGARSSEDLARQLVRASGMEVQARHLGRSVLQDLEAFREQMPPGAYEKVKSAVEHEYRGEDLLQKVQAEVESALDASWVEPVTAWLESPLGRRVVELEEATAGEDAWAEMRSYAEGLRSAPPSQHRLSLVWRLDSATDTTELAVELAVLTGKALAVGIDAAVPESQRLGEQEIRRQARYERGMLHESFQEMVHLSFLYAYRDLSDEDLARYADFSESKAGERYHAVLGSALRDAMAASTEGLARRLAAASQGEMGAPPPDPSGPRSLPSDSSP